MNIPEQIKAWREGKGFTQEEAAQKLNVSARTLEAWEQGRSEPRQSGIALLIMAKVIEKKP